MSWPTMWPSALGTTAYCSHLFCTSPPRLRRKIGWLSEEGSVSPGVAGFPARRMPLGAPEGVGRQRRCDAAESIDIPVSTWDTIQRIHVGPRGLRGNRIKEALAC